MANITTQPAVHRLYLSYRYGNVNKNKSPALDIKIIEDSHAVHQKNRRRV
jgi:hypothetical protein